MRLASSTIAGLEMNALGAEGSGSDGSALDHQMQPDNDSAYTNDVDGGRGPTTGLRPYVLPIDTVHYYCIGSTTSGIHRVTEKAHILGNW